MWGRGKSEGLRKRDGGGKQEEREHPRRHAGGPAAVPGQNVARTPRAELGPSSTDLAAHLAHGSGRLLGDGWCVTRGPSRAAPVLSSSSEPQLRHLSEDDTIRRNRSPQEGFIEISVL